MESPHDARVVGHRFVPFTQFFDAAGDGSGSTDMAVDGSGTAVSFKVTAQAGEIIRIERIVMLVYDDTETFEWAKFGSLAALTNGLRLRLRGGSDIDLHGDARIKTFADLICRGFDAVNPSFVATDYAVFALDCRKAFGAPLRIDINDSASLEWEVKDAMDGLDAFQSYATGFLESSVY